MKTTVEDIEKVQDALFLRIWDELEDAGKHDYHTSGSDMYRYAMTIKTLEEMKSKINAE